MNDTTTDAAEARALTIARDMREAFDKLAVSTRYDATDRERWAAARTDTDEIIRLLATAEAASGAGEREKWQEKAEEIANACGMVRHSSVSAVDRDAVLRDAATHLHFIASLPPATDPAMVEADLDAAAKLACETFYGNAWQWDALGSEFQQRWRDVASAALAAAPTIPATGHAATEGEGA